MVVSGKKLLSLSISYGIAGSEWNFNGWNMMISAAVDDAMAAMREIFPETPLQLNEHLSRRFGAEVWLKREDLSPVRSYKIRGAFNFLRKAIANGARGRTFVCASAGNHAQGFAFVCRHF
jgi:threonine dehydratase